jgi:hypothetical protein
MDLYPWAAAGNHCTTLGGLDIFIKLESIALQNFLEGAKHMVVTW